MLNLSHHRVMRHRARTVFVLFVLLFGSLNSVATLPANAQPLCLDGKIWDADAEECVDMDEVEDQADQDDQTAEPTEEDIQDSEDSDDETDVTDSEESDGVEDSSDEPSEDSDDDLRGDKDKGTATIYLFARACPTDFDPIAADESSRQATCTVFVGGAEYDLIVVGVGLNFATTDDTGAPVEFGAVPIDREFTITHESVPAFSGPAVVQCSNSADASIPAYEYTFSSEGGSFSIPGLNANDVWDCTSYFIPITTGEITAYVYDCPAGTDIQTTEPDVMLDTCNPYLQNIQFELDLDGLISSSSTNTLGSTTYVSVPPGQYRLMIDLPDGYGLPVVFCTVRGPNGQTIENYDRFDVSNVGSIGLDMDALENTACDFFLAPSGDAAAGDSAANLPPGFPADAASSGAALDAVPGSVYINIFKLNCPDGFVAGPDASVDQCAGNEGTDIGFVVTSNNDTFGSDVTDANGFADFTDVPAGDITVQEALPVGYGKPMVGCTLVDRLTGQLIREYQQYEASPDGIVLFAGIQPDQSIYCMWLNIPTSATGSIDAIAWSCPEGYDIYTKSPEELIGECGQKLDGVEFQLQHATAGYEYQFTSGQRSTAYFRDIPPGQLTLRESMPTGYGIPVVFCQATGPDGQTIHQYDRYDVSNSASIQLGVNELDYFKCDFFQVLGGQPVQIDADSAPSEGFPGGTPGAFEDLPLINQDLEAVIGESPTPTPRVFGDIADIDGELEAEIVVLPTPTPRIIDDIAVIDGVLEAELVDATPGEVTIVKHVCIAGFDAYNATALDINGHCAYDKIAIFEFNLTDGAGGYQIQHTEMGYPLAEFELVAPGAISIMESVPPGFGDPVVYCQSVPDVGEPTPYTRFPVVNGNTLQINLPANQWLACDWFNVPVGTGSGTSPSSAGTDSPAAVLRPEGA